MDELDRPPASSPTVRLGYDAGGTAGRRRRASPLGVFTGLTSILAAVLQFVAICASPRMLFFHASDAATEPGPFTRLDRLCFLIPALLAVALSLVSLRRDGPNGPAVTGMTLALLALLLIGGVGFSK